jgi:predicted KAP-like P-loop ATPase
MDSKGPGPETRTSLSADRPLDEPGDDRLGYRDFARTLAHSVLRGSPAEGLVVAIYGEWGLGKTTLLNFIEHFVRADPDADEPIVLRFNPWWFSGRDDLLARFFAEFEAAVAKSRSASAVDLAKRLKPLARAVSKVPGFAVDAVVPGLGRYTEKFGSLFGTEPPLPAFDIKRGLSAEMAKNLLRIFVLIDDIDRLLPSEMVDIFRFVRAIADLPNVTYLLAMDRTVVTRALSAQYGNFGDDYLEKIVQVSFDLPVPNDAALSNLFLSRLNALLSKAPAELVDLRRWQAVYDGGVRTFLNTPRDVVRFLNALALTFPGIRDEVNPIDFVAIEALRMFQPVVYRGIQEHADKFVGAEALSRSSDDQHRARLREFHEAWLPRGDEGRAVRQIVAMLFPIVAGVFAQSASDGWDERAWRASRRVCAVECFYMYFRYSLGDEGLPRLEVSRILAMREEDQRVELERLARSRNDGSNRFRQIVEGLADRASAGNTGGIKVVDTLLRNLFRIGDILDEPAEYPLAEGDDEVLATAIEALLRTLPEADRVVALRDGLPLAGVSFAARFQQRSTGG